MGSMQRIKHEVTTLKFFVMNRLFTLCTLMLATIATAAAQLSMPSIFGDKMVLQQSSEVKMWGKANPSQSVELRASWSKERIKIQADSEGRWVAQMATPTADRQHHTLTIKSGKEQLTFEKVMLGEVWLCGGQSNMVMYMTRGWGNHIAAAEQALMLAPNDDIRLFQIKERASITPLEDVTGAWSEANTESLESFSSTAYFFAHRLQAALDVPVAVITTAWGGSKIAAFMSSEAIEGFDDLSSPTSIDPKEINLPGVKNPQHITSVIYNGMVNPIVGYTIKGMLWYQGESDRDVWEVYPARFETMIKDLRAKWGCDFPIHMTEIAPYNYPAGANGALMREVLTQSASQVEQCHIISLLGLGMKNEIHPPQKDVVGYRFARSVLDKTYGWKSVRSTLARPTKIEYSGNKVIINLTPSSFPDRKEAIEGFEVAGEDRIFHKATAYMKSPNHRLEVSCAEVEKPVAVRYQYYSWVEPAEVIYDSRGNPLTSFRSDDWSVE